MIKRLRTWLIGLVEWIRAKLPTRWKLSAPKPASGFKEEAISPEEVIAKWDPGVPDMAEGPKVEGLKAGSEIAKQLITLSVGMIALTITFLKEIVDPGSTGSRGVPLLMVGAWVSYTICILGSVATLMGICGAMTVLDQKAMKLNVRPEHEGSYDVYATTVRFPMKIMVLSFLVAIALTISAAASAQQKAVTPVAEPVRDHVLRD